MINKEVVYFTSNLNEDAFIKIFDKLKEIKGEKLCIKVHTGEKNGPNIIPSNWVKKLYQDRIKKGNIVETNTYYEGDRYDTLGHRKILKENGWTFSEVDILDEDGYIFLDVNNGKWFDKIAVGKNTINYDSLIVLTHFKGHSKAGFGGANKNIGIGFADGRLGKKMIHTSDGSTYQWDISYEEFMERMTESTKAVLDHFNNNVIYINVLRNMSIDCDCEGINAAKVTTPNIGILASNDILSIDKASVDLVYGLKKDENKELIERIESRHGLRQLSYMEELNMGNINYYLYDIDKEKEISIKEALENVKPFEK